MVFEKKGPTLWLTSAPKKKWSSQLQFLTLTQEVVRVFFKSKSTHELEIRFKEMGQITIIINLSAVKVLSKS